MDIRRRIRTGRGFTPTEQQLGNTVLALGERLQGLSIKELARLSTTSIASIHRFCKKLGLEGYKELKVALARDAARDDPAEVDINFPFAAGERATEIVPQLRAVYESTLRDTAELIEPSALNRAAEVLDNAACIDIYTQSHNLYPAQMFCDRLLSAGRNATCHESPERLVRTALATGANHAAVAISYSGLNQQFATLLPILAERGCPVVFIGTAAAQRLHPGLTAYLTVSDREHLQDRITQFASHIAVQYALDALYGCLFARDYERSIAFLERSLPYTRLPGSDDAEPGQAHPRPAGTEARPSGTGPSIRP